MEALKQEKKFSVISLLMEKKYLSLMPITKMLIFQLSFVLEVYLMNMNILQQINFTENVEKDDSTIIFFSLKSHKTTLNFSLDSLIVTQ